MLNEKRGQRATFIQCRSPWCEEREAGLYNSPDKAYPVDDDTAGTQFYSGIIIERRSLSC